MRVGLVFLLAGPAVVLASTACRGGAVPQGESGPPPEVVEAMTVPDSPYYIIYHPPVDLAQQPGR